MGMGFDAMAPWARKKELFVNVIVSQVTEDNPMNHVKNWMGGLMKAGSKQYKSESRSQEIVDQISGVTGEMVKAVIQMFGWESRCYLIDLPPSHGNPRWMKFLQLAVKEPLPVMLVYRVELTNKLKRNEGFGMVNDFFSSCCELFVTPEAIKEDNWDNIGMGIQDCLRQFRNPIRAQVQVMDAPREWQVLHSKGWSEELSSQAIEKSRRGQEGPPMGMGGPPQRGSPMPQRGQY